MEQMITDEQLFSYVHQTQALIMRRIYQLMAGSCTMLGQYKLMFLLHAQPNLSQREIADLLQIRPSSAGELIERAVKAGIVLRVRDEKDNRVFRVSNTEKGEQVFADSMKKFSQITREMFQSFNDSDRTQMMNLLVKMKTGLEEICQTHQ